MPLSFSLEKQEKLDYLNDIYRSILYKDLVQRYNIRDINVLERLIRYITDNIGNTFSANSISNYLKYEKINVSNKTIYNYISYLKNTCLISKAQREDLIGKRLLKISEKYYLIDHGFNQAILGENTENIGRTFENIVYIELLRRDYKITIGKINNLEVDFVCKRNKKKIYIQVSYLLHSDETIKREFNPLLKIKDNYDKYVISLDNFDFSHDGIKHFNIIDFLINENSL